MGLSVVYFSRLLHLNNLHGSVLEALTGGAKTVQIARTLLPRGGNTRGEGMSLFTSKTSFGFRYVDGGKYYNHAMYKMY